MRFCKLALLLCAVSVSVGSPGAAAAESRDCDRSCLRGLADQLVASIVARDSSRLPLTPEYSATENSVASALNMMPIWHTATAAKHKFYVIDPTTSQLFLAVTLAEGGSDTLLFGRLKVADRKLSEIELYTARSRGDVGFQFDARGLARMPRAWTDPIPAARRASRAELLLAGQSVFDTSLESPPTAPSCVLMENGKVVAEDPEVLKAIMPPGAPAPSAASRNKDGMVSIPCGSPPDRPTDKKARVEIIDEQQSIVVSIATINGLVEPYVITRPTESAYVPFAMLKPYEDMLERQKASGKYTLPAVRRMPASITVAHLYRMYDGRIQGMHMLQKLGPPEGKSPWVSQ